MAVVGWEVPGDADSAQLEPVSEAQDSIGCPGLVLYLRMVIPRAVGGLKSKMEKDRVRGPLTRFFFKSDNIPFFAAVGTHNKKAKGPFEFPAFAL